MSAYLLSSFWPVKAACFSFGSRMFSCASQLLTHWLPPRVSWKLFSTLCAQKQGHPWREERSQHILVYFIAKWAAI